MLRLKLLLRNAGVAGILQLSVVALIFFFALRRDISTGDAVLTIPILAGVLVFSYLIREFLIDHFDVVRWIMNGVAVVGIILFVVLRNVEMVEPLWLRALIVGVFGFYMGCYFWMLSDWRTFPA
ncbi:hypothetical protein Pan216_48400 [Planctomycetes bacterium Pan216]|uniref:Uncharacterized protein n=1 Tax=Kolteria novifilia TaxID=2527975 RepID=A0A518BAF7_9BACT|nr:hypothetical protein Pan216_48400 [Planctomycetes bacterium Pan216]